MYTSRCVACDGPISGLSYIPVVAEYEYCPECEGAISKGRKEPKLIERRHRSGRIGTTDGSRRFTDRITAHYEMEWKQNMISLCGRRLLYCESELEVYLKPDECWPQKMCLQCLRWKDDERI